ncbi:ABC transporter permease [Paenibacillus sp. KN14-4R]|uniref:ABC transporter permease n=1 Tax=Paenibacillus sp. KN14-4R TaxID=3445773 RepID=UPI003FA127DC
MRVFELYMRRIIKRKMTFIFMLLLPIMFTFMVVAQYKEATKVNLTLFVEDQAVDTYVSSLLEKQGVTLTHVKTADESIHNSTNMGIVFTNNVKTIFSNPDQIRVEMYAKETNYNSKSLEIKLNSVFSTLKTLAKNAKTVEAFEANMKQAASSTSPIKVESSILGNPNAAVLTSTFNMIAFIMLFLTMTNTLLFLGDKVHTTTQRVLLSTSSKLSYYLQTVGVFAVIGIVQFLVMIVLMKTAFAIDLWLSIGELLLLVLAYGLLNVISAGIGLLIVSRTTRLSTGRLLITVVSLPLAMLGGTLWPSSIMPEGMQSFAKILPTNWVTELNIEMFSGFSGSNGSIMVHFMSLLLFAVAIFFLLTRVKTEDI